MKKINKLTLQKWLPIKEINKEGVVKLKNNKLIKIIKVNPINYNLKSNLEKESILNSYKIFLKTCNFNIQILIQSNKEDLNNHISKIKKNISKKENKIFEKIANNYIDYINKINSERKSSSKDFYIIISGEIKDKNNQTEEILKKELTEKYFKIKECLSRSGNFISELSNKKDVENLFAIVRNLKKEGISVVFISHKLDEMMDITDRITILNNGKKVATVQTSDINEELLAEMVVGKTIKNKYPKVRYEKGETLLRFEHITLKNHLNDISFELKRGEVLGIVGLLGAGKTEIAKALFGVYGKGNDKLTGNIWFNGKNARYASPVEAVNAGIGYISEDRGGEGLQVNQAIDFNISLAALKHIRRGVFLDLKKEKAVNQKLIEKLQVKCESMKQKVTNLSGGNQQKVVIAKWFASKARIIVLDEPTRGIDIGAKVEVYKLINEMVEAGIGVILLSSEVPEVFGMADRILVLKDGQITGEYGMDEINKINETDLQRLVM